MTNSLLRQSELGLMSSRMDRATPRYAIQDLEDTIELSMEVPGVKAEDITVEIEDERLLRVKGSRTLMEHGTVSKIEFDQAFDVGDDISTPDIKVELSSGILRISAPKRKYEAKKTKIPIEVRESSSVEEVRVEVEPKVEVDMSSQAQHDNKTREEKEEAQDELTIIEDE
jgi:HSP20 family molecular chaperone IbpA